MLRSETRNILIDVTKIFIASVEYQYRLKNVVTFILIQIGKNVKNLNIMSLCSKKFFICSSYLFHILYCRLHVSWQLVDV